MDGWIHGQLGEFTVEDEFPLFPGTKEGANLTHPSPGTAKRPLEQARQAAPRSGALPMSCSSVGQ